MCVSIIYLLCRLYSLGALLSVFGVTLTILVHQGHNVSERIAFDAKLVARAVKAAPDAPTEDLVRRALGG